MEEGVDGAAAGFVSCPREADTFDKARDAMTRAVNHKQRFMFSLRMFTPT
jgi:hypothetical protein